MTEIVLIGYGDGHGHVMETGMEKRNHSAIILLTRLAALGNLPETSARPRIRKLEDKQVIFGYRYHSKRSLSCPRFQDTRVHREHREGCPLCVPCALCGFLPVACNLPQLRHYSPVPYKKYLFTILFTFSFFAAPAYACPLIGGLVDYNCDGKHQISIAGDSIVFGTGDTLNNNRGGYVLRLKQGFKTSQVYGFGYPGITTANLLSYYKRLFLKKPKGVEATQLGRSDIVILDVGRNDYFNRNSSTLTATTIKRLTSFLSSELEKRFGSSPLFVTTILPLTRREIDLGFIQQVNMVLLKIRGRNLPAFLRFDKLNTALLSSDGLHPTSAGYNVLANIAAEYITGEAQVRSKAQRKDVDQDGIYDLFEKTKFKTSPKKPDTDDDGLKDGEEVFTYETDAVDADTDGDGVSDEAEVEQGTNPKG